MAQRIQLRNDTTVAWEASDPILAQGEVGVDTTLNKFKIGNGTSTWTELEFASSGDIADFVFDINDGEGEESRITVANHDMVIRTTRTEDQDADIDINSADDVWIYANGDDIHLYAADDVEISTNWSGNPGAAHTWEFTSGGRLKFPDGTYQTTAYQGLTPPADFLNWREGTTHLPDLNTHFGWNSDGIWFQNSNDVIGVSSYPIFTDFTIPQNQPVIVEFDFDANSECNDIGVCVYVDGTTPEWEWNLNTTRIAAQFDCFDLELYGRTTQDTDSAPIPESGFYTVTFTYNPTAPTDKVTVSFKAEGDGEVITTLSINEALPAGAYRVGFAADQGSSSTKTYMSNLSIDVNNDDSFYEDSLEDGNSGASDVDLVLPVAIKDGEGDDFITFTRTSNNTARIETPQDDLSLRSARDITLFAGSEGPGNVYIGWGDADQNPDATNRVATIGDIQSLTTGDFEFNNSTMFTEDTNTRIQAKQDNLLQGAAIEFDPYDGHVALYGYTGGTTTSYSTTNWTGNATWSSYGDSGSQVVLNGATALITFLNDTFNQQPVRLLSINGSDYYEFDGMSGNSENVTLYTIGGAPLSSTTVTSLEFRYQSRSVIEVNDDDEEILIEGKGLDVNIRSTEDISFRSNLDDDNEYTWAMGSNGQFRLPGDGYIENVVNGSGEGGNGDTIKIVPDSTLGTDQYIIIDPTNGFEGPDHIHIRPGGTMDDSTVNIILGGEKNAVIVSDDERAVGITTRPPRVSQGLTNINEDGDADFVAVIPEGGVLVQTDWKVLNAGTEYTVTGVSLNTPTEGFVTITATGLDNFGYNAEYVFYYDEPYVNTWAFTSNGYINGPAMGGLFVTGLLNGESDLWLSSNDSVVLNGNEGGEFLGNPDIADNQIATLGDIGVDTTFTVVGGTLGTQPTFTGAPLFTGSYVKTGPIVHFRIDVDMDNITSFGTGQYYLDLPFPAKYNYEFTAGCLHDISATRDYPMTGHIYAGESRMLLKSLDASGNSAYAVPFTATAPVTLTTADNFHISGDYIWDVAD
jgi:hypothetical protein